VVIALDYRNQLNELEENYLLTEQRLELERREIDVLKNQAQSKFENIAETLRSGPLSQYQIEEGSNQLSEEILDEAAFESNRIAIRAEEELAERLADNRREFNDTVNEYEAATRAAQIEEMNQTW
jgi:hypothetical protein